MSVLLRRTLRSAAKANVASRTSQQQCSPTKTIVTPTLRRYPTSTTVNQFNAFQLSPASHTAALSIVDPPSLCSPPLPFAHHAHIPTPVRHVGVRYFHVSSYNREQASSKIEETVKAIQERKDAAAPAATAAAAAAASSVATTGGTDVAKVAVKKSIRARVWEEVLHYYHGFRLLFIDINVARKLLWKTLLGTSLTRREYMLLVRTTGDVFRLVPFSVFIIVPFMELLLPVFIKFFPGMLPSTFETAKAMEDKARTNLKVKLEMAKFLQKTLDEMDVHNQNHSSDRAREFTEFFNKLRTSGERATPEEIMRFSKLFEDEITLDSLSRPQLAAICRVLEVPTYGTSAVMRFLLRMKLRSLAADDRMIQKEGVETLSLGELQSASRARGMRSYGLAIGQLRNQVSEWIHLSLNEKVPPSLLLLSRAMMLPEDVTTSEKLKASMTLLSDSAAIQTKAAIGEKEGKIDNKTKIEIIRDEQRKIKEELEEQAQIEQEQKAAGELLVDKAKVLTASGETVVGCPPSASTAAAAAAATSAAAATAPIRVVVATAQPAKEEAASLTAQDIETVSNAIGAIGAEKKTLMVEKEEIKDLKEEIAEYKEDVEELNMLSKTVEKPTIKESNASKNLLKKVDSMISKLDKALEELEAKEAEIQAKLTEADEKPSELVRIDEIIHAIRKMQKVPNESKVVQIQKMLGRIDDDKDGHLKVDDVLRIIQEIGKESVALNEKQVDELMELITKEEKIENEQKIEKALAKSLEEERKLKEAAAAASKSECELLRDARVKVLDAQRNSAEEMTDKATKVLKCDKATKPTDGQGDDKQPSKTEQRINHSAAVQRRIDEILPTLPSKTKSSSSSSAAGSSTKMPPSSGGSGSPM